MRVLVCGDRNWGEERENGGLTEKAYRQRVAIHRELLQLRKDIPRHNLDLTSRPLIVVEGRAKGADSIAGNFADVTEGFEDEPYPADWNRYGKSAGPIRNKQMLDEGRPQLVLAFHENIAESRGTLNMIKQANKAGIEVRLYAR
jgi:hypothetical protein